MINNVIIIHMQDHVSCNQNVAEYRNIIQACGGTVFEYSPKASSKKCGGFYIKRTGI